MNTLTPSDVAVITSRQINEALWLGEPRPTRVLMDHRLWDEIVRDNLPHSRPGEPGQKRTFMGLEVLRTRDKEGIVEVLP
jgi:hypothetical protein